MKIALIGYGKMGKIIESLAINDGHEIILKVDSNNATTFTIENLRQADVAIEFSRPDKAVNNINRCFEAGIPVVVGTTGWLEQLPVVRDACATTNGGLFHASNFSIGVNLFFALNRKLAQLMEQQKDYKDIFIHEIHHVHKLDAPSGTAITLADQLLGISSSLDHWMAQPFDSVNEYTAPGKELPIFYTRTNEVPGTHTVHYASSVDEIEITHKAYSREGFARGALTAARWMVGRKGVYSMSDLLHL